MGHDFILLYMWILPDPYFPKGLINPVLAYFSDEDEDRLAPEEVVDARDKLSCRSLKYLIVENEVSMLEEEDDLKM